MTREKVEIVLLFIVLLIGIISQLLPYEVATFERYGFEYWMYCLGLFLIIWGAFFWIWKASIEWIKYKKLSTRIVLLYLIPLATIGSHFYSNWILENRRNDFIVEVKKVIKEIDNYKLNREEYPEDLSDLIPEYIKQIPTSGYHFNSQIYYRQVALGDKNGYNIGFSQSISPLFRKHRYYIFYGNITEDVIAHYGKQSKNHITQFYKKQRIGNDAYSDWYLSFSY